MDEFTADAFVNRDEPIPIIDLEPPQDLSDDEERDDGGHKEGKRERFRSKASALKNNLRGSSGKAEGGPSMQDRLLEK